MFFETISTSEGVLLFSVKNKILHALSIEDYELLLALIDGEKIEEICEYSDNPKLCLSNLRALESTWNELGLLSQPDSNQMNQLLYLQLALETIRIESNSTELIECISSLYASCAIECFEENQSINIGVVKNRENETFSFTISNEELYTDLSFENAILFLCFQIGELATNEKPRLFTAHAAGITKDNFTILLPAAAGSGKSTLTAYLINHGFKLLNDDIVPINFDGTATCVYSPLKIKEGSWTVLKDIYPSLNNSNIYTRLDNQLVKHLIVDEGCLAEAGREYPVNSLVIPCYKTGVETTCKELNDAEKLKYFLGSEPYLPHKLTRTYLQQVCNWLGTVKGWRLEYCDMQEVKAILKELVSNNGK